MDYDYQPKQNDTKKGPLKLKARPHEWRRKSKKGTFFYSGSIVHHRGLSKNQCPRKCGKAHYRQNRHFWTGFSVKSFCFSLYRDFPANPVCFCLSALKSG